MNENLHGFLGVFNKKPRFTYSMRGGTRVELAQEYSEYAQKAVFLAPQRSQDGSPVIESKQ